MRRWSVRIRHRAPIFNNMLVELNTIIRSSTMITYNCLDCGKECIADRHNRKANKYCSISCQQNYQYKLRIKEWLNEGKDWGLKIPNWVHRYLSETYGYKCAVCGISEYNNMPIKLECDHIDGNHTNNKVINLRLICPNCHSQTPTYKNRNAGKGRTSRRKISQNICTNSEFTVT